MDPRRPRVRVRRRGAWDRNLDPVSREHLVQVGLPRLLRAARHEIAVREAAGDLPAGAVDAYDVVDQALVEMLPSFDAHLSLDRSVLAVQHRIPRLLDAMVARLERGRTEPVDEDDDLPELPGRPRPYVDDLDDGPSEAGPPAREVDDAEGRALLDALFELPAERRRVFEAVVVDGWRADHVGHIFGLSEAEVEAELARAIDALASLAGCEGSAVRGRYEALGERLHDAQADDDYFSPGHAM